MDRILFSVVVICLLSSCLQDKDLFKGGETRVLNCTTSESFTVPVKEGYATYVTCGSDTLAVATQPIVIQIPKKSDLLTKSDAGAEIKVNYEVLNSQSTYSRYWQAVLFEDSRNADYDYNDLIIHVRNSSAYKWGEDTRTMILEIQPIALGSQKQIKLGCMVLFDRSVHIISEDVRKDLFHNASGFVNTESMKEPVRYKLEQRLSYDGLAKDIKSGGIAWFIEVEGERFFAVGADLDYKEYDILNNEGMPYGLVFYGTNGENGTFAYAEEKTSLFEAYPDFRNWINGKKGTIGKNIDRNLIYKYNYGGIPGKDGNMYKIWDYEDLK